MLDPELWPVVNAAKRGQLEGMASVIESNPDLDPSRLVPRRLSAVVRLLGGSGSRRDSLRLRRGR